MMKIIAIVTAVIFTAFGLTLTAFGLTALTASPSTASSGGCSYGAIGTSYFTGPPGSATVWLGTADVPARCGEVRAEAWAQGNPSRPILSGWVKNPGIDTTAYIPKTWHDPTLLKATEWRQHTDGSHCQKRQYYPTVGSWTGCSAAVHLTAAAGVSVTHTGARVKASRSVTGPRFFAFGDSKLYGSIQGPVRTSGTSVACNSGQPSDPCESAGRVFGGYYLHTPAGYVLRCTFGACPHTTVVHSFAALKRSVNREVAALCPGNTVNWKVNQPWAKWAVQWNDNPAVCAIQAALLFRNPNLTPTTKWRRGGWKQKNKTWSKVGAGAAPGYSACKGNMNISTSGKDKDYGYATIYLWPQCANPPAHLTRNIVRSGNGTATIGRCSRPFRWATGYTGGPNGQAFPYAQAQWKSDPQRCGFWIQTRVYASHGCPAEGHSGAVRSSNLWARADGVIGNVHLCFGAVHFRANVQGSKWTNWERIGDTSHITTMAAAVRQHWTQAKLRAALDPGYGPFLICAYNHPIGKDRMGMWYGSQMSNVIAEPCDASREWHIIFLANDINGVPEVNIQAVADGFSLASSKGCTWVVRHADVNTEGTLWKLYIHNGDLFIANSRCSGVDKNGNPRYNMDAATNNRLDNRWFIADRSNPEPGDYIRMSLKVPPSAATMAVCSAECISWHHQSFSGGRSLFSSWWTQNRYGMQQRARAHCVNPATGRSHYNYGNWKVDLSDRSQATCYKPYVMTFGCYQQRATSGSPTGTTCPYSGSIRAPVIITTAFVQRSCDLSQDHWKAAYGRHVDTQQYVWIEWTADPCDQGAQSSITCHNPLTGENQTNISGAVREAGTKAEADCQFSWQALACFKRLTKADGSWGPWTTVCVAARRQ